MISLFKKLLVVQFLCFFIFSYGVFSYLYEFAVIQRFGYFEQVGPRDIFMAVLQVLYLVAYLGMFWWLRWARTLLVVVNLAAGVSMYFYVSYCFNCLSSVVGFYMTIIDGFLISTSYLTSVSCKFERLSAPSV